MVDWRLSEQLAGMIAGEAEAPRLTADLGEVATRSEQLVSGYTGLHASAPLPPPEALSRREWIQANLVGMRGIVDPLTERIGEGSGPLAGPARAAGGFIMGAEVGLVTGYLAQKVLGQYEFQLLDPASHPRLLFVTPNLGEATRSLKADPDELITWVALHEITHALQFGAVGWLREHLAGLLRQLLESAQVSVNARQALKLPSTEDLARFITAVRNGDLLRMAVGQDRMYLIDQLQATMAVIEGYAEHVMDATGRELIPSLPKLRDAFDRRRRTQSPAVRLLNKLLGMEMKLRQYESGKQFCDGVVDAAGIEGLNAVWRAPEAMPSLDELAAPNAWLARVAA